jgi:hypothetical protein
VAATHERPVGAETSAVSPPQREGTPGLPMPHIGEHGNGTSVPNPFQICPPGVAFVVDLTDKWFKRDAQSVRTRLKTRRIATATPTQGSSLRGVSQC